MFPANDLRVEVYIRSMSQQLGLEQLKRILDKIIPQLELELIDNPNLDIAKSFSHSVETKILM